MCEIINGNIVRVLGTSSECGYQVMDITQEEFQSQRRLVLNGDFLNLNSYQRCVPIT